MRKRKELQPAVEPRESDFSGYTAWDVPSEVFMAWLKTLPTEEECKKLPKTIIVREKRSPQFQRRLAQFSGKTRKLSSIL